MSDRDKIIEVLGEMKAQVADIEAYLASSEPVVEPPVVEPVDPPVGPVRASAPVEVFAPSGQNVALVPVTLDRAADGVSIRVVRVQNASPATINVGDAASQARYLPGGWRAWDASGELTQAVRLQLPGASYRDGQQVIYHLELTGAEPSRLVVKVTFRDVVAP